MYAYGDHENLDRSHPCVYLKFETILVLIPATSTKILIDVFALSKSISITDRRWRKKAVDKKNFTTDARWTQFSAPYCTISVKNALSDLPEVNSGASKEKLRYEMSPQSHFQRKMMTNRTTSARPSRRSSTRGCDGSRLRSAPIGGTCPTSGLCPPADLELSFLFFGSY